MAFSLANTMKAQLYDSEICYYIKAGVELNNSTRVYCVKFEGSIIKLKTVSLSKINEIMSASSSDIDRNWTKETYNPSMSTSSKTVYQGDMHGNPQMVSTGTFSYEWRQPVIGKYYHAFSLDKGSLITWNERNNSNSIYDKSDWIRVNKSDLKPQSINRDFLYE